MNLAHFVSLNYGFFLLRKKIGPVDSEANNRSYKQETKTFSSWRFDLSVVDKNKKSK